MPRVMHAHLHDPPPTLLGSDGEERDLRAAIANGMAKAPDARYGHARDLLAVAARAVRHLPQARRLATPAFPVGKGADEPTPSLSGPGPLPVAPTATDRRPTTPPRFNPTRDQTFSAMAADRGHGWRRCSRPSRALASWRFSGGAHKAAAHQETLDLSASLAPSVSPRPSPRDAHTARAACRRLSRGSQGGHPSCRCLVEDVP